jgi:tRNA dimethylallyltransferase
MLYFKALREGLSPLPSADPGIRARLDARAAVEGWPALHAELTRIDPVTAVRLKHTDAQRIQRALEVYMVSGRPMSTLHGTRSAGEVAGALAFALIPSDRADLHWRIALRFEAMLAAGLVEEVRALRERHALGPDMPSMRCVGYRQAWQFLDGVGDSATLREHGIAATRQLAKRQFTWLRTTEATVFDASTTSVDHIASEIAAASVR